MSKHGREIPFEEALIRMARGEVLVAIGGGGVDFNSRIVGMTLEVSTPGGVQGWEIAINTPSYYTFYEKPKEPRRVEFDTRICKEVQLKQTTSGRLYIADSEKLHRFAGKRVRVMVEEL